MACTGSPSRSPPAGSAGSAPAPPPAWSPSAGSSASRWCTFLKYPANPPATGDPATLQQRTGLYFLLIVIGVAAVIGAVLVGRSLQPRLGTWNASTVALVGAAVLVGAILYVLPAVNEVPDGFSPILLWRFRLASLGTQAVTWATLGLLFGYLTERSQRRQPTSAAHSVAA